MKKTVIALFLSLCMLCSCSEKTTEDTSADSQKSDETPDVSAIETDAEAVAEKAYYTVELDNGNSFKIGEIVGDTLKNFGDPLSVTEAPSCVYDGVDKLHSYSAYTITTSPDADGNERISEFSLISDSVSFKNGISIGSEKSAVESAFGTDYTENFGVLKFTLDGAELSVVLDSDNTVSAITVTAK